MRRGLSVGVLIVIASASLLGCAHERMTYLSNGHKGYSVTCGRFYQDWTTCVSRAGRLCRDKGYTVAYSDEINREMIFGCKESKAQSP